MNAFQGCSTLKTVTINTKVTSIESRCIRWFGPDVVHVPAEFGEGEG